MRLKFRLIALALVALAFPAAALGVGNGLTAKLETDKKQKARDLVVTVTCVDDPCSVTVEGKARAGGRKFQIRPKARSLEAREPEKLRLRPKKLGKLEALLVEEDGLATVTVRATNAEGAVARLKGEITLTG
jgi:hypothetical protein